LIHLLFLNQTGSNNPLRLNKNTDKIPFDPYFTEKNISCSFFVGKPDGLRVIAAVFVLQSASFQAVHRQNRYSLFASTRKYTLIFQHFSLPIKNSQTHFTTNAKL